ncbi:DNA polymerase III subunit gamma/tau [Thermoclostridium stercorarium]|nr:DNA polymerase III subunit gamma/tau [Thermoclostridium stercorarium]
MIKTSHLALYRMYRPQTFDEVVEQQHIVTTLKNAVISKKIAHAYLFCGTRGTGKTTMAKIFARAVNCLNPVDGNPCNKCEICRGIIDGTILDVMEIDAASNNSVDNIRNIIDEVVYTPTRASRKVYIIDEVHMLSIGAFNALLKTLEEPPEHVIFILATTEPHKLPATVLSRCQRFDFRRITSRGIANRLISIAKDCGVALSEEAALFIASLSEGALRDGISILDQCISTGKPELDLESVQKIVGVAPGTVIINTVGYFLERRSREAISQIDLVFSEGMDPGQFIHNLIRFMRDILIFKTTGDLSHLYSVTEEEKKAVQNFAGKMSMPLGLAVIRELTGLEASLRWSSSQRILIETAFLRICSRDIGYGEEELAERIQLLEDRLREIEEGIVKGELRQDFASDCAVKNDGENGTRPVTEAFENGLETNTGRNDENSKTQNKTQFKSFTEWESVLKELSGIGRMKLYSSLIGTKAVWTDDKTIGILFQEEDEFKRRILNENGNMSVISDTVKRVTGLEVNVSVLNNKKEEKNSDVPENILAFAKRKGVKLDIIDE